MNTIKRFWALCLDTHMKLALYNYAIVIIIMLRIVKSCMLWIEFVFVFCRWSSDHEAVQEWGRFGGGVMSKIRNTDVPPGKSGSLIWLLDKCTSPCPWQKVKRPPHVWVHVLEGHVLMSIVLPAIEFVWWQDSVLPWGKSMWWKDKPFVSSSHANAAKPTSFPYCFIIFAWSIELGGKNSHSERGDGGMASGSLILWHCAAQ